MRVHLVTKFPSKICAWIEVAHILLEDSMKNDLLHKSSLAKTVTTEEGWWLHTTRGARSCMGVPPLKLRFSHPSKIDQIRSECASVNLWLSRQLWKATKIDYSWITPSVIIWVNTSATPIGQPFQSESGKRRHSSQEKPDTKEAKAQIKQVRLQNRYT